MLFHGRRPELETHGDKRGYWWRCESCSAWHQEGSDFCTTWPSVEWVRLSHTEYKGWPEPRLLNGISVHDRQACYDARNAYRARREAAAATGRAGMASALSISPAPMPNFDWDAAEGKSYAATRDYDLVTADREGGRPLVDAAVWMESAAQALYVVALTAGARPGGIPQMPERALMGRLHRAAGQDVADFAAVIQSQALMR